MHYQLTYIVPSDIADFTQLEKIISGVNANIAESNGTLKNPITNISETQINDNYAISEELKKIADAQKVDIFKHRLAYHVKHHRFAFYISNIFSMEESKNQTADLKKLENALKKNSDIIRFITVGFNIEIATEQAKEKKKERTAPAAIKPNHSEKPEKSEKAAKKDIEQIQENEINESSRKSKIEDLDKKLEQILNA